MQRVFVLLSAVESHDSIICLNNHNENQFRLLLSNNNKNNVCKQICRVGAASKKKIMRQLTWYYVLAMNITCKSAESLWKCIQKRNALANNSNLIMNIKTFFVCLFVCCASITFSRYAAADFVVIKPSFYSIRCIFFFHL